MYISRSWKIPFENVGTTQECLSTGYVRHRYLGNTRVIPRSLASARLTGTKLCINYVQLGASRSGFSHYMLNCLFIEVCT